MKELVQPSPLISVLLVTYNHENHVRQALDCLFGQIIEMPIELIVADDGSSDNTVDIIKEYEKKDARFNFKYMDKSENLGITKNYQRGFSACTGEYVAVLEGDDYWVSPLKLQRQLDFLKAHWECDLCSVNYFVFEESLLHFYPRIPVENEYRLITARDLISDNLVGNFSTCMYRKSSLDTLPSELFEITSYDWIVNICIARKSMIGFLEEPMSVYRLHSKGVWSQTSHVDKLKTQLALIPAYDELTNYIYHSDFDLLSNRLKKMISMSNISHVANAVTQPSARLLSRLVDYVPPILLVLARALTPPKLKVVILHVFCRSKP